MRKINWIIVLVCLFTSPLFAVEYIEQEEINALSKNLKCLVCVNQSVAESQSDFANFIRGEIKSYLDQGYTDQAIYTQFSEIYGAEILLKPPGKSNAFALWLLPLLFVIISAVSYCFIFRKRT